MLIVSPAIAADNLQAQLSGFEPNNEHVNTVEFIKWDDEPDEDDDQYHQDDGSESQAITSEESHDSDSESPLLQYGSTATYKTDDEYDPELQTQVSWKTVDEAQDKDNVFEKLINWEQVPEIAEREASWKIVDQDDSDIFEQESSNTEWEEVMPEQLKSNSKQEKKEKEISVQYLRDGSITILEDASSSDEHDDDVDELQKDITLRQYVEFANDKNVAKQYRCFKLQYDELQTSEWNSGLSFANGDKCKRNFINQYGILQAGMNVHYQPSDTFVPFGSTHFINHYGQTAKRLYQNKIKTYQWLNAMKDAMPICLRNIQVYKKDWNPNKCIASM